MKNIRGFTLLELMIAIAIASILLTIGVPSFRDFFERQNLKGAAEQVYSRIQRARSEAITRKVEVGVNFSADGSEIWSYGLSDKNSGTCDTAETDISLDTACTLAIDDGDGIVDGIDGASDWNDRVLMTFTSAEHEDVAVTLRNFENGTRIVFEPLRGTAREATGIPSFGEILFESRSGHQLMIRVGLLGQVRICSPDGSVTGYVDGVPGDDAAC
ncbi:GspH/FimT family pseudopilin [Microbulbifer guangxiensis]|uniref:GspH/FimT family pseudopilin n=1 Tax=Microbulbifer guangxiensis TaxID=2904249 RepID=UPI001F019CA7|nr:GspH/FimT family pseudopilin [Microbulbifer guangxiensis]